MIVTATNQDDIETIGAAIGAGSVGVSVSGNVNVLTTHTNAFIGENARVNQEPGGSANQDVLVAAANDYHHMAIVASAAGGTVGVTANADVTVANLHTAAYIDDGAWVDASRNVEVKARGHEDVVSFSFAVAGGFVGVAVPNSIMVLNSSTSAYIGNDALSDAAGAKIDAGGSVLVSAKDDTDAFVIVGGIGGGAVGASSAVTVLLIDKDTGAWIGNHASVDAKGLGTGAVLSGISDGTLDDASGIFGRTDLRGLAVEAESNEDVFVVAATVGIGFYAGIAAAVAVEVIESDTKAFIGDGADINQAADNSSADGLQAVSVTALNDADVFAFGGGVGGGIAGIGGGVNVGILRNNTTAGIGGSNVSARGSVNVSALANKEIDTIALSAATGGGALAGSVSVWTIGDEVNTTYSVEQRNADGNEQEAKEADSLGSDTKTPTATFNPLAMGTITDDLDEADEEALGRDYDDTIHFTSPHGYKTGDRVVYRKGASDNQAVGGLSDGATYYVIRVDDNSIRLARNPDDASSGKTVLLDKSKATGTSHRFEGSSGDSSSSNAEAQAGEFSNSLQGYQDPGDSASPTDDGAHQQSQIAASAASGINANSPAGRSSDAMKAEGADAASGTTAFIASGSVVIAGDDVGVRAKERIEFESLAGTASVGAAGIGAGISIVTIGSSVEAYIGDATVTAGSGASDDVSVEAILVSDITGKAWGGQGGGVALGAQVVVVNDNSEQLAHIDSGADINRAGKVLVKASADRDVSLEAIGIQVAGAAAGASVAVANVGGSTMAWVNGDIGQGAETVSSVEISATSVADLDVNVLQGSLGAGFGLAGAVAVADYSSTVEASTGSGSDIKAANTVTVTTDTDLVADADALAGALSISGAMGASLAFATARQTQTSRVGGRITTTSGSVIIDAVTGIVVDAKAGSVGGGLIGGAAGAVAIAQSSAKVDAMVAGTGAIDSAGSLTLNASTKTTATGWTGAAAVGGLAGIGVSISIVTIGGHAKAQLDGDADTVGAIAITSSADNTATATALGVAGGIGLVAGANIASATVTQALEASIGNAVEVDAGTKLSLTSTSKADAQADAFGVNAGAFSIGASLATATTSPTIDTTIGSSKVSAGSGGITLTSLHNRNADGSLIDKGSRANATAAGGGALLSAQGAAADAEVSVNIETAVFGGSTLNSVGAVQLRSYANEKAVADAGAASIGGAAAVGGTLADATIKGEVLTHFDGKLESGASLALEGKVDAKATVEATAIGGAILVGVNGTSADATIEPEVRTYIGGTGNITVAGDVSLDAQILTEADALASAITFGLGGAVGATPATAKVESVADAGIRGGASVTSTTGDIMLTAANNFSDGKFLTGKGANVSTDMTTVGGVSVSVSSLTATAEAEVVAEVGAGANLNAASGNVSVDARSSNFAEARTRTTGGGLVSVASSSPKATAGGATRAKMLGNVGTGGAPGAQNIVVTAQSSDIAAAGASATTGGAIDVGSSSVEATASPTVEATIGGQTRASDNITVQALSTTDADASSRSTGGGVVSVGDLDAEATATPTVLAGVAASSLIAAGDTLSISALHGANPGPVASGNFAPAAVNVGTNTIDLGARHGLLTGDTVTYQAGSSALGGVTDGRQYGVIFVTDNTLQLGAAFDTDPVLDTSTPDPVDLLPNPVDLARDTIRFAGAHNLQTDDRVIYHAAGGFTVGGLTEGGAYLVNVIDAQTIKLVNPAQPLQSAKTFTGAGVAADVITTTTPHGFVNGQAVTYRAPAATQFDSTAADVEGGTATNPFAPFDNNNIYLGAGHGLNAGDEVIYTAATNTGASTTWLIGGLVNGGRYFVILDALKPDEIQLAATHDEAVGRADDTSTTDIDETIDITPILLTPTKDAADRSIVHSLRKVGDQAIGGLTDGVTYYVSDSTATTFKLKDSLGAYIALTPTDPVSDAVLTGTHSIRTEGVDLTSLGTGEHELAIDITGAGSGTHTLEGVGGARALAGAPSGDGVVTSAASGSGGGVVRVSGASTDASSTPTVNINVQSGAALSASEVVIEATAIGNASSLSANSGGGLVSVGSADSAVAVNTTGTVNFGSNASVDAINDITIRSITGQNATVLSQTGSGGLAGFGDAAANANLDYSSTINIGTGVMMMSEKGDLLVESQSSLNATATADSNAAGLGASADTEARMNIDGVTRTTVGQNARLDGRNVDLKATVTEMKARSKAESDASAAIADADADAEVSVDEMTDILLLSGAWVEGDSVDLVSRHQGIDLSTRADADADGLYGDADAPATTDYESSSAININDGATVAGHSVLVQATQSITRYDRSARADSGFFGDESSPEGDDFNAGRDIRIDGDIVLLIRPDPVLSIDENGRVTEVVGGITVNGGHGLGYDVTADGYVSVDNIGNLDVAGSALVQANTVASRDSEDAPDSTISGTTGTARVKTTYDAITISNLSGEELRLNNISPANPDATGLITLDAQVVTAEFDIADSSGPTDITVINDGGTSDVLINGLIDNPTGLTIILNEGGEIQDGPGGTIRTNDLVLTGTELGTAANRLDIELVRSVDSSNGLSRTTGLTATSAGDVYFDLTGRLRDTVAGNATFATGTIEAGGHVDLLLQTSLQETDPIGVVAGITFTVTQDPLPHTASYVNHFRPDAGPATSLDPAIYADTSKAAPIASTWDFGHLVAGGNVIAKASAPGVSDTTVNIFGNTNVLGTGYVEVLTNGDIDITETAGDLRIFEVRSNEGDVSLASATGSLYEIRDELPADTPIGTTPWVIGNSVSLRAAGGIGFLGDFLEINSSQQASGVVDALGHDGVYLVETAGDLNIGDIASQESNVVLYTFSGSMLDANPDPEDEEADIQGRDIDLLVNGGASAPRTTTSRSTAPASGRRRTRCRSTRRCPAWAASTWIRATACTSPR